MDSAIGHLRYRLRSIYKALGQTMPVPAERFAPTFIRTPRMTFLEQNFRGGMTDEDIHNVFEELLCNIAHAADPLRRVLRERGKPVGCVTEAIRKSRDLALCVDLANWYKHGRAHHGRTESGHRPAIKNVDRVCRIEAEVKPGAVAGMTYSWEGGRPRLRSLGGTNEAVFEGDVVEHDGTKLGDVMEIASKAVVAWERLLREFSIS